MQNIIYKEKIIIPSVGLLNLSRKIKKNKKKYINDSNSNLYNICYMNSSIQCLFHLDEFVYEILNFSGGKLINATSKLINDMITLKDQKKILSVSKIKEVMEEINKNYKESNQEDAYEFLSFYIDEILEETMDKSIPVEKMILDDKYDNEALEVFYNRFFKKRGNSSILDLFYGIYRIEKYCANCKFKFSIRFNAYNILELPILDILKNKNESLDIKYILEKFCDNQITNSTCDECKNKIFSITQILTLPKCLILYLGIIIDNIYIKNNIILNKTIDLEYLLYNKNKNKDKANYKYILKGIIYHSYIDQLGHYSASCLTNNGWYYFDDIYVEKDEESFIDRKPIILFYEKE